MWIYVIYFVRPVNGALIASDNLAARWLDFLNWFLVFIIQYHFQKVRMFECISSSLKYKYTINSSSALFLPGHLSEKCPKKVNGYINPSSTRACSSLCKKSQLLWVPNKENNSREYIINLQIWKIIPVVLSQENWKTDFAKYFFPEIRLRLSIRPRSRDFMRTLKN